MSKTNTKTLAAVVDEFDGVDNLAELSGVNRTTIYRALDNPAATQFPTLWRIHQAHREFDALSFWVSQDKRRKVR